MPIRMTRVRSRPLPTSGQGHCSPPAREAPDGGERAPRQWRGMSASSPVLLSSLGGGMGRVRPTPRFSGTAALRCVGVGAPSPRRGCRASAPPVRQSRVSAAVRGGGGSILLPSLSLAGACLLCLPCRWSIPQHGAPRGNEARANSSGGTRSSLLAWVHPGGFGRSGASMAGSIRPPVGSAREDSSMSRIRWG